MGDTKEAGLLSMRKLAKKGKRLRQILSSALQAEKVAVRSAMDSHREFQMALEGRKVFVSLYNM